MTIDAGTEHEYPRCQELIRKLIGEPPRKLRAAKPDEVTENEQAKVNYHQKCLLNPLNSISFRNLR